MNHRKIDLFFAALLFQMVLLTPFTFSYGTVTNPSRGDGFGGQFQTIVYSVIYAELTGKKFCYSPFSMMEHNYDGDADYLEKKERLINFIGNFPLENRNNPSLARSPGEYIQFFDGHMQAALKSQSLRKIRSIFRENKNVADYFSSENLNIAIHIRRQNPHDNRSEGTTTPDDLYLRAIERLRSLHHSETPLFHIYSQGDEASFRSTFSSDDVILHIDETVEQTFAALVLADVLVIAPSSLSYTAGILSEGEIYYVPFWHPPLPHWRNIEEL